MEEIIKKLEETDKIYGAKLDDAIEALKEMDVKDEQFDKLLNRVSSLISLKLQKENFIEEYEMRKAQKDAKKEMSEFKKFISKGNVVDMAVGVIIGGAFGKIVTSLVNDIITPAIGIIIGGLNFSNLSIQIGEAKIMYGNFIQTVIDFLIIAICIFSVIRIFERVKNRNKKVNYQLMCKNMSYPALLDALTI